MRYSMSIYDNIINGLMWANLGIDVWQSENEFVQGHVETQLAYFYGFRDECLEQLKAYRR